MFSLIGILLSLSNVWDESSGHGISYWKLGISAGKMLAWSLARPTGSFTGNLQCNSGISMDTDCSEQGIWVITPYSEGLEGLIGSMSLSLIVIEWIQEVFYFLAEMRSQSSAKEKWWFPDDCELLRVQFCFFLANRQWKAKDFCWSNKSACSACPAIWLF